jgi:hypothetical protein
MTTTPGISTTTHEEDLRKLIAGGNVVFIVGSGVSYGAAGENPVASWKGLLKSGLAECGKVANVPQKQLDHYSELVDTGDTDNLLSAASFITGKLKGPTGGAYKKWLKQSVGRLDPKHRDVLDALKSLRVTLATTNYDRLLEDVTKSPAFTWQQTNDVESIFRGDAKGIVHILDPRVKLIRSGG